MTQHEIQDRTNLRVLREHLALSVEQMAQIVGVPVATYALVESGYSVGRQHRQRFSEFFGSEWLANAVRRAADPIVLNALGIFAMPALHIPEQFR